MLVQGGSQQAGSLQGPPREDSGLGTGLRGRAAGEGGSVGAPGPHSPASLSLAAHWLCDPWVISEPRQQSLPHKAVVKGKDNARRVLSVATDAYGCRRPSVLLL